VDTFVEFVRSHFIAGSLENVLQHLLHQSLVLNLGCAWAAGNDMGLDSIGLRNLLKFTFKDKYDRCQDIATLNLYKAHSLSPFFALLDAGASVL
jgi:hypothetical protein